MKILKSESFMEDESLAKFVNKYAIPKEDILIITHGGAIQVYTLFYYADSESEEKRGWFS